MPISAQRNRVLIVALGLALMAGCKDNAPAPTATAATTIAEESADSGGVASDQSARTATVTIAGGESHADASETGKSLVVKGVAFTVPDGWIQEQANGMGRVAQFVLPGDAEPASLVITYWGSDGAGPRDLNIERWIGQFAGAGDSKSHSETVSLNGLEHTTVTAGGSYAAAPMRPGSPRGEAQSNQALYGVILEGGPEGPLYLKSIGPAETIAAQTPALEAFCQSARKAE